MRDIVAAQADLSVDDAKKIVPPEKQLKNMFDHHSADVDDDNTLCTSPENFGLAGFAGETDLSDLSDAGQPDVESKRAEETYLAPPTPNYGWNGAPPTPDFGETTNTRNTQKPKMSKLASKLKEKQVAARDLYPKFSPELKPRVLLLLQHGQLVQVSVSPLIRKNPAGELLRSRQTFADATLQPHLSSLPTRTAGDTRQDCRQRGLEVRHRALQHP